MFNIDYLYNPQRAIEPLKRNWFLDKKLGFQVIENGMVLPYKGMNRSPWTLGGIVDSKGNFIQGTAGNFLSGGAYPIPSEFIRHSSETVIYLGFFNNIWGHITTDCLRSLWFLKTADFKNEFKNCPLVYMALRNEIDLSPDFKRLLSILEIDADTFQGITQPTQFERIIVPDSSFSSDYTRGGFTAEYREMIDQVRDFGLKNRMPTSIKKLYFLHGGKGHLGEERVAEYFKSKGYAIITPEQRSNFDEELNLLVNAESFASQSGSVYSNLLFLRDGTETVYIPRSRSTFATYDEIMNQVHPLNVNYVDSSLSIFTPNVSVRPVCFIISEQLKRFFGDKWNGYEEEDFKTFLEYVSVTKHLGRVLSNLPHVYYRNIADFTAQLKQREDLTKNFYMPEDYNQWRPLLSYQTYVRNKGWGDDWKVENQISNPLDQKLEVSAIRLKFPYPKSYYSVYYSVYYKGEEGWCWSKEIMTPKTAGTFDLSKPICGIRIMLDETGARKFDIFYRVHKFDDTWTPWAKNGGAIYTHGQLINSIQVKLKPIKILPNEADLTESDYAQKFLVENDGTIYLQERKQDLTQIELI